MGLWVLETYRHAPGTVQLIDDHAQNATGDNVLLVPHPSKSPNDPLVSACHLLRILYLLTKGVSRIGQYGERTWHYSPWLLLFLWRVFKVLLRMQLSPDKVQC